MDKLPELSTRDKVYPEAVRPRLIGYALRLPEAVEESDRLMKEASKYRSLRHELGLSREQLAGMVGVPKTDLALFENGFMLVADMPEDFEEKMKAVLLGKKD